MATGDALTNAEENALLDTTLRNQAYTSKATFVALLTALCDEAGTTYTEPLTASAYSRATASWNAASGGSITNNGILRFGTASASWGSIIGVAIFPVSGRGSGTAIYKGTVVAQVVGNGDIAEIASGALVVLLD